MHSLRPLLCPDSWDVSPELCNATAPARPCQPLPTLCRGSQQQRSLDSAILYPAALIPTAKSWSLPKGRLRGLEQDWTWLSHRFRRLCLWEGTMEYSMRVTLGFIMPIQYTVLMETSQPFCEKPMIFWVTQEFNKRGHGNSWERNNQNCPPRVELNYRKHWSFIAGNRK